MAKGTCSIDGCDRPTDSRGWCKGHYARWTKTGDVRPDEPLRAWGAQPEDHFWRKVDKRGPDECWEWTGSRDAKGYGRGRAYLGGSYHAHRFAYELLVGPIPDGLQLDHLCLNTSCVNPAHLEPVTNAENMRRRYELMTHCKRGHEFTLENTLRHSVHGGRVCKTCLLAYQSKWKRERRARGLTC